MVIDMTFCVRYGVRIAQVYSDCSHIQFVCVLRCRLENNIKMDLSKQNGGGGRGWIDLD